MAKSEIQIVKVTNGVDWVSVPSANCHILCGCPADVVKHLLRVGLIVRTEREGVGFETGPNCILLSDVPIQNGHFANLAEFPVLQMLYRQGMILPRHPNNTGVKPLLIGNKGQIKAQLEYIYRGNYGLTPLDEVLKTGVDPEFAEEIYRIKLWFAFGKIASSQDFIETRIVEKNRVEIKNGVFIKRTGLNRFQLDYEGESVTVDLNLPAGKTYIPSYHLGFFSTRREHFAVIHSGEGDGWNPNLPCMSSILVYSGFIYLIDAAPNLIHTLNSLGISLSEIRGIFHTHCHDDHFSGLTVFLQADHRVKYFSTALIRASVSKKLSALMSVKEDLLTRYFDVYDLEFDKWNEVEGMLVKPSYSPHPVETANYTFKVIAEGGYREYAHLADISSFDVLRKMAKKKNGIPGISKKLYEKVKKNYLTPADVKKIDVGGGLIHGNSAAFASDRSKKILLSHRDSELTNEEKEIGSRASFGMLDTLIPSNSEQVSRYAKRYLNAYYPSVDFANLRDLLNCPIVRYNPGEIILKSGEAVTHLILTLTGTTEMIHTQEEVYRLLPAGTLIGEVNSLLDIPIGETFVTLTYVDAMKIPVNIFRDFVERNSLTGEIMRIQSHLKFLRSTWLFSDIAFSPVVTKVARDIQTEEFSNNKRAVFKNGSILYMLVEGRAKLILPGKRDEFIGPRDFCFEDSILENKPSSQFKLKPLMKSTFYTVPGKTLSQIPSVMWKLLEKFDRRVGRSSG
jgi:hemerythrin